MDDHSPSGGEELNLTSLMDIFTIVVIFLLVTVATSVVEVREGKDLSLAESERQEIPGQGVMVVVTRARLSVDDTSVSSPSELRDALEARIKAFSDLHRKDLRPPVLLIVDREMPYREIEPVLMTIEQSGFSGVDLILRRQSGTAMKDYKMRVNKS